MNHAMYNRVKHYNEPRNVQQSKTLQEWTTRYTQQYIAVRGVGGDQSAGTRHGTRHSVELEHSHRFLRDMLQLNALIPVQRVSKNTITLNTVNPTTFPGLLFIKFHELSITLKYQNVN